MEIRDIKLLYERITVGDLVIVEPSTVATFAVEDLEPRTPPFAYPTVAGQESPYILFVHGWNMERWEKDRFAETAFKRLYWQGYSGHLGSFRWPTDYGFKGNWLDALFDSHNYDNSENSCWKSALGLLRTLESLNTNHPGRVYVLSHSMGNVAVGEALRLAGSNEVVNTYIASQAALPAHVYDGSVTNADLLTFIYNNPLVPDIVEPGDFDYGPETPNIYRDWLAGNSAGAGRRLSYYNGNDFALVQPRWGYNQILKPDTFLGGWYGYSGSTNDPAPWNNFYWQQIEAPIRQLDIVVSLVDRYEAMSYAAESRSAPLGLVANVGGLSGNLDLTTVWPSPDPLNNSYGSHFWHSAQFRGSTWEQWAYWETLLTSAVFGFDLGQP